MRPLVYLCSPYTHADPAVRESRYRAAVKKYAELMQAGEYVFSPIAHTHEAGLLMERPVDHDFWLRQDKAILRHCDIVKVLMIEGWSESAGISEEVVFANLIGIPVEYINP